VLNIPDVVDLLEGEPRQSRADVAIVVARFNGEVTDRLLASALAELERVGFSERQITIATVPGAFELPLAALALAKTGRYACIAVLGCVIRGETAHFDYVAGGAATGLQTAALDTGVPVAFGVLTVDTHEQAIARTKNGAAVVRTALEMADLLQKINRVM
jgi:6,7-dimethyl-8-ribityllumazine synthase